MNRIKATVAGVLGLALLLSLSAVPATPEGAPTSASELSPSPVLQIAKTTRLNNLRTPTSFYVVETEVQHLNELESVTINYRFNGGRFLSYEMDKRSPVRFAFAIPKQSNRDALDYYIEAKDVQGNIMRDPANAPKATFHNALYKGSFSADMIGKRSVRMWSSKGHKILAPKPTKTPVYTKVRGSNTDIVLPQSIQIQINNENWIDQETMALLMALNNGKFYTSFDKYNLQSNQVVLDFPEAISREKLVNLLVSQMELPVNTMDQRPFNDVFDSGYIAAAKNAGLVNGFLDGTFRPYESIDRKTGLGLILKAAMLKDGFRTNQMREWVNSLPGPSKEVAARYLRPNNIKHFAEALRFGFVNHSSEIPRLKQVLTTTGYYAGPINGMYDIHLANAIYKLQKAHGIVDNPRDTLAGKFSKETVKVVNAIVDDLNGSMRVVISRPDRELTTHEALVLIARLF